ncbi:MAG: hypothetical protein DRQ55_16110 [Planctomycetota bacterium]|nr:MAG: hypothetical protein DRQ55_16110 [Planctomycetota bacterium]
MMVLLGTSYPASTIGYNGVGAPTKVTSEPGGGLRLIIDATNENMHGRTVYLRLSAKQLLTMLEMALPVE